MKNFIKNISKFSINLILNNKNKNKNKLKKLSKST
jgi:hypothetical protein